MRFWAFAVFALAALGQDERRVTSPNGQIEFRLFLATQESNRLPRLAYEVFYHGKPLIVQSFLGLDIEVQEPLLGENVGLTGSIVTKGGEYNSLVAKYMQNGSLGRLINVEVRAYDAGVAFRYLIPRSTPLLEPRILAEETEFRFAEDISAYPVIKLSNCWVVIGQSKSGAYPGTDFAKPDPRTLVTRLVQPFSGATPFTIPWRTIAIGASRESVIRSTLTSDLNRE